MRWYQHSSQGTNPADSLNHRLPAVAPTATIAAICRATGATSARTAGAVHAGSPPRQVLLLFEDVRRPRSAAAIVGTKLDDDALAALTAACEAACKPIDDKRGTVEFRTEVAAVLARRAAKLAFQRAGGK